MKKKNKTAIFLSSYNYAKYLSDAINSILSQTYPNFELIIVDDASSDESWNIIQNYSDIRVRSYKSKSPSSGEYANKLFSELPQKEYIAIHHSDDIWEPEKLEKQVAYLDENPEVGAVFTWAKIIDDDGNLLEDKSHPYHQIFQQPNRTRHEWLNYFFYKGNALCHPSVLIRKRCYEDVGLYRYGMAQLPDFDMWVRLAMKYEIHVMPEKLIRFRIHQNESNSSGNRPEVRIRIQFEYLQVLENYRKIASFKELKKIFPVAKKYERDGEEDIGFALGMIAVETGTFPFTKLFGLELLFEALNDPARAKKIKELYNFSHQDFIQLSAKYDVFSVEARSFRVQLRRIVNGKARKIALLFRQVWERLFPLRSQHDKPAQ